MNQYPPVPPPPGYPPSGPAPGTPPPNNALAITALILGILSPLCLGCFTGVPAIICGHIARGQIRASNGTQSGDGMALAGLILGYISLAITLVIALLYGAVFAAAIAQESGKLN